MDFSPDASRRDQRSDHQKCKDVRLVAEHIRNRKHLEYKEYREGHPSLLRERPGKFTLEYVYMHCSSYKRIVERVAKEVPSEQSVRILADVLECGIAQRNDILIAAGYTPDTPYLSGNALQASLKEASYILSYLPLPAYSITRDWDIHDINDYALQFLGIQRDVFDKIPQQQRNILHLIFDPSWPIRRLLGGNSPAWKQAARSNILGYKAANQGCKYEPWYVQRVATLCEIDGFKELWDTVHVEDSYDPAGYQTQIVHPMGVVLRYRTLTIVLSDSDAYPQVVAYIPQDAPDQMHFARAGLPVPGNMWGFNPS
jgi:hypothetical protein